MAQKKRPLPETLPAGPQIPAEVRQGGDVYLPGKSGINIIKKGKKRKLSLTQLAKRKPKKE